MGKRFKTLRSALKYLRSTTNEDGTVPAAPAGSMLEYFQKWDSNQRIVEYTRDADSKPGQIEEVAVHPFGVVAAGTQRIIVAYSKRAQTAKATAGMTDTLLNYEASLASATEIRGFEPAKAVITIVATTAGTSTDSKLTGRKYKKKANKTYTFPFGQGTGTGGSSYASRKADFITAAASGTTNRTISFKPEKYV